MGGSLLLFPGVAPSLPLLIARSLHPSPSYVTPSRNFLMFLSTLFSTTLWTHPNSDEYLSSASAFGSPSRVGRVTLVSGSEPGPLQLLLNVSSLLFDGRRQHGPRELGLKSGDLCSSPSSATKVYISLLSSSRSPYILSAPSEEWPRHHWDASHS